MSYVENLINLENQQFLQEIYPLSESELQTKITITQGIITESGTPVLTDHLKHTLLLYEKTLRLKQKENSIPVDEGSFFKCFDEAEHQLFDTLELIDIYKKTAHYTGSLENMKLILGDIDDFVLACWWFNHLIDKCEHVSSRTQLIKIFYYKFDITNF